MKHFVVCLVVVWMFLGGVSSAVGQVYEFSKPNVPVNDDLLGRYWHYPVSAGMHSLAVRGDTLYATWYDNRDGSNKIYFSKSTNRGVSWSANVIVNDTALATHIAPAITLARSGEIFICWKDDREQIGVARIYCSKSIDGGASWGRNVPVSQSSSSGGLKSSICADQNGRVFIAWGAGKPYLSKSTDGGQSFGPIVLVADSFYVDPGYPSIGVDDSGKIYMAFASPPPGGGSVFTWFTKAVDYEDTSFLPPKIVSDTLNYRNNPSLVLDIDADTYIVYEAVEVPCRDIHLVRSTDRGLTFGSPVRVNDVRPPGLSSRDPSIAVDTGNGVYVTWCDDRSGPYHGYFAVSTNGGLSFWPSVVIEDTSVSPGAYRTSQNLAFDANTGIAYVIWVDERWAPRVAWDIYSARGVLRSGVEERAERLAALNEVRLEAIYPNPMREKTSIRYALSKKGNVCLTVYNVAGQRVCTLREGVIEAGVHEVIWVGRDVNGKEVKAGVYFIGLESEGSNEAGCRLVREVVKLR